MGYGVADTRFAVFVLVGSGLIDYGPGSAEQRRRKVEMLALNVLIGPLQKKSEHVKTLSSKYKARQIAAFVHRLHWSGSLCSEHGVGSACLRPG